MRSLTVFTYALDPNDGAYLLTGGGDRIIVGTGLDLEYDESYSRIAGAVSKVCHIRSFNIDWSEETGRWRLMINKTQLIGFYSTQQQALGVLAGLYRRRGVNTDDKLTEVISYELSQGASTIAASTSPIFPVSTAYFSYGKAPVAGLNEFYWSKAADVAAGETPDLDMSGVIGLMNGGNANLTMIYPDSGANSTISTTSDKIWKAFDVTTWNGTDALPQMDPAEYVASVQYFLDEGRVADAAGEAFCFDWELGTLNTAALGSIYWNTASQPRFQAALIELRSQQKDIYDALKLAFPDSYFGMYGGTIDIGQNQMRWDGTEFVYSETGKIRWYSLLNATQEAVITQNFTDALAGTEQPWDYVTKVCYDPFAPDSYQRLIDEPASDGTAVKPTYIKELNDWSMGLMKSELTVDCLAIISPSNIAIFDYGTTFNDLEPYEWATPSTWVEQTIAQITAADGYLIWDGLRIDQTRQFMVNYANWAAIVAADDAVIETPVDKTPLQDQMNKWFNLLQDLEDKYGSLTTIANQFSISVPASAEDWFNLDRTTVRNTDFVRNELSKHVIADLESTLIPLIETWRTTGVVPFAQRSASTISGTADIGQTLTAVTDFVGTGTVDYRWRNSSGNTNLSTASTYTVQPSDVGETIECRIRVRDQDSVIQENITVTTSAVPFGASGSQTFATTNDFGFLVDADVLFTAGDALFDDFGITQVAASPVIGPTPASITLSFTDDAARTAFTPATFTVSGTDIASMTPTESSPSKYNFSDGAAATASAAMFTAAPSCTVTYT